MQFIDIVIFGFALVVPWFALIVSAFSYRLASSLIALSIGFCVPYLSIIFLAKLEGDRLDAAIAQFDLNRDGVFSAAERTPAAEAALLQYANDTGLAMAPIFGALISLAYLMIVGFLVFAFKEIRRSSQPSRVGTGCPPLYL